MSIDNVLQKDNRLVESTDTLLRNRDNLTALPRELRPVAQENEQQAVSVTKVETDIRNIRETLEQINKVVPIANTKLLFEFDELGDPPIIKVIDKSTNELIREIPSQDLVKVAKAFSEMADNLTKSGVLVNFQA
ncbi:MAG: flagellar protein FlaG [Alishewanella agri]|nr:flagellar protein FlaG [Alishewanella agri]